jgi:hypothetical protein
MPVPERDISLSVQDADVTRCQTDEHRGRSGFKGFQRADIEYLTETFAFL